MPKKMLKPAKKPRTTLAKLTRRKTAPSTGRRAASFRGKVVSTTPPAPQAVVGSSRANTKQATIIKMLRAPAGTTIDAMMRATGWQPHSVRGFLAGVVRKKLGLNLTSQASEGDRVYRIVDRPADAKTNEAA